MTRQQDERNIRISGPLTALSVTAAIKADQLQVRINQGFALPSMQVHDQIAEVSNEVNEALRSYIKQLEKAQTKMNNLIRQNTGNRGQQNNRRQASAGNQDQKKAGGKASPAKATPQPASTGSTATKPTAEAKPPKSRAKKAAAKGADKSEATAGAEAKVASAS